MGTQTQDPNAQKQGTAGTPGGSQEQRKPLDREANPPGKRSPQQGKDVAQSPTGDDDESGEPGTDTGSSNDVKPSRNS
jgi:hypothetical protein